MLVNGHSNPSDPTVTKRFTHFYAGPCGEYVSSKGWWARARQMDSVSFGDIWDVSLSCRRGLFYRRLYPGGRVQNSSVKMWLLYIQTAFGKLCLYEFIKPDLSFQSGCVTACQVSAEDDGAYYDRQKKRMSTSTYTQASPGLHFQTGVKENALD